MLVLTRKKEESIMIGDEIEITVVSVSGGQVQLGIDAPRGIPVHRKEVYDDIKQANIEAAEASSKDVMDTLDQLDLDDSEEGSTQIEDEEGDSSEA